MRSTAQRQKKINRFDANVGLELNCQFATVNSISWNGYVMWRQDGNVLRRALDFQVEGQGKKWKPKRTWKKQVEEESVKVGLRREVTLASGLWALIRLLLG